MFAEEHADIGDSWLVDLFDILILCHGLVE